MLLGSGQALVPGHLCVGSKTRAGWVQGPQLDGRPAGPPPAGGDAGSDGALEWPGGPRSLPVCPSLGVVGAQTRRSHGCPGTWSHIPSPPRRAGSPRPSPMPTMALGRGVNQGPAGKAVTCLPSSSQCSVCLRRMRVLRLGCGSEPVPSGVSQRQPRSLVG